MVVKSMNRSAKLYGKLGDTTLNNKEDMKALAINYS